MKGAILGDIVGSGFESRHGSSRHRSRPKEGPPMNRRTALFLLSLCVASATLFAFPAARAAADDASFQPQKMLASVCTVETADYQGSGLVVTSDGHVLTNAHVLDGATSCTVYYGGGTYDATLLRVDRSLDLAVLSTGIVGAVPAEFAETEDILAGMDAYVAGSPDGLPQTITRGIVSVVGQPYYGQLFLQTDAAVNSGNSGGPLCAADGRVRGLVTFTMGDAQELGFAIPDPTLLGFLHQAGLLADRSVSPLAGIEGIPGYYDTSDVTYDDTYYSDAPTSFLDDPDAPAILLVVCAVEGVGIAGLLAALVVVLSRRRGRRTKRTA